MIHYLTSEDIAFAMKIPVRTARRKIKAEMIYVQVGRQFRVDAEEFAKWQGRWMRNTPIPIEIGLKMVKILGKPKWGKSSTAGDAS